MLKRVIFVGGKGGVGKSSTASSLAYKLSKNEKILLISTDPAHNLCDIFGINFSDNIINLSPNLDALQINPDYEATKYIKEIATKTRKLINPKSYHMLDEYYKNVASSQNAKEAALFERLCDTILQETTYRHIVIDTAPTGHTLRIFFMPKLLKNWAKGLLSQQERASFSEDIIGHFGGKSDSKFIRGDMVEILEQRYQKYSKFENILKNDCDIILVLNPELLAINETQRAIESLRQKGLDASFLVINKILPKSSNDEFLQARIELQYKFLGEISSKFSQKLIKLGLKRSDIVGIAMLDDLGSEIISQI